MDLQELVSQVREDLEYSELSGSESSLDRLYQLLDMLSEKS